MLILGLLMGALVFFGGFSTGFVTRLKQKAPEVKPKCECTHSLAYHDPKTGRCNNYQPGVVDLKTGGQIQCECRQYTGPEPISGYYAPEIQG